MAFPIANLSVALAIIGILATMLLPNFLLHEFVESFDCQCLLKSVRECQSDLIKCLNTSI